MGSTAAWLPWAAASAAFAALTTLLAKAGLRDVDPDFATLVRTAVLGAVLAAFVPLAGKWRDPATLDARTWAFLAGSGLAAGASWLCYFRALKAGDAAKVAPVDKLSLVLVAVLAAVFLGERPSAREWGGIALVAAGVLVIAVRR